MCLLQLLQIAEVFSNPARHDARAVPFTNAQLRAMIPTLEDNFHFQLDQLEAEILRAKAVLRQELAEIDGEERIRREAEERRIQEAAAAEARRLAEEEEQRRKAKEEAERAAAAAAAEEERRKREAEEAERRRLQKEEDERRRVQEEAEEEERRRKLQEEQEEEKRRRELDNVIVIDDDAPLPPPSNATTDDGLKLKTPTTANSTSGFDFLFDDSGMQDDPVPDSAGLDLTGGLGLGNGIMGGGGNGSGSGGGPPTANMHAQVPNVLDDFMADAGVHDVGTGQEFGQVDDLFGTFDDLFDNMGN